MINKVSHIFFCCTIAIWLITGCSPKYVVKVDSMKSEVVPEGTMYVLLPGLKDVHKDDLLFKEFSTYIVKILEEKGYKQVSQHDECQLLIYLSYGLGIPKPTQYLSSEIPAGFPAFKKTNQLSSPAHDAVAMNIASLSGYVGMRPHTNDPYYGPYGFYDSYPVLPRNQYQRYLILEAVDYPASKIRGETVPVWKLTVTSRGESDDLREVFPALVVAGADYIGTNTGKQVEIFLSGNDARIKKLK